MSHYLQYMWFYRKPMCFNIWSPDLIFKKYSLNQNTGFLLQSFSCNYFVLRSFALPIRTLLYNVGFPQALLLGSDHKQREIHGLSFHWEQKFLCYGPGDSREKDIHLSNRLWIVTFAVLYIGHYFIIHFDIVQ